MTRPWLWRRLAAVVAAGLLACGLSVAADGSAAPALTSRGVVADAIGAVHAAAGAPAQAVRVAPQAARSTAVASPFGTAAAALALVMLAAFLVRRSRRRVAPRLAGRGAAAGRAPPVSALAR